MADVDVLIVGAGSTGAAAAAFLAEAGFDVLAVDRRAPREAGARWLNAVPPWCFEEAGLGRPRAPERWGGEGEHASVVAIAGGGPRVRIEAACTDHVDMRLLVARLQERAERAGARFERNRLVDVEREGDRVRAVKLADRRVRPA
ncbi:MAG TPA: FAD-dependent oxidoreductase, partial [Polyangiaceae bacterium LLY-WYZ-15_(1-7)]|nr:FAD-dependent oxidoreductase [Polyangiaceae bacterium LLY-WYZ-15_(1-7)]